MAIIRYPFPIIVICLSIGIFISSKLSQISLSLIFGVIVFFILISVGSYLLKSFNILYLSLLCKYVLTGVVLFIINTPSIYYSHYSNWLKNSRSYNILCTIKEELKPTESLFRFVAEIHGNNKNNLKGKLLIYLPISNKKPSLEERYIMKGKYYITKSQNNPYSFDYSKYLRYRKIYGAFYVKESILIKKKSKNFVFHLVQKTRYIIENSLNNYGFSKESKGILYALLLGNKNRLTPISHDIFKRNGVIHTLAISGLHVGIIYLLIQKVLSLLLGNKRNLFKLFLILLFLWYYAMLIGFSPSVTRAVFMFSILAVGSLLSVFQNKYNTLAFVAFIILIIYPYQLFNLGFQLSFGAVLGIFLFYQYFVSKWKSNWKILNYLWKMICISISAQCMILPVLLYHFNQFPIIFPLSNLYTIPLVTLILWLGIIYILSYYVFVEYNFLAIILENLTKTLHDLLEYSATWKYSTIESIPFSMTEFIVYSIGIFIMGSILHHSKRFKKITTIITCIVCITVSTLVFVNKRIKNEIVFFQSIKNPTLAIKIKSKLYLIRETKTQNYHHFQDYIREMRIREIIPLKISDSYSSSYFIMKNGIIFTKKRTIFLIDQKLKLDKSKLYRANDIIWSITPLNKDILHTIPPKCTLVYQRLSKNFQNFEKLNNYIGKKVNLSFQGAFRTKLF